MKKLRFFMILFVVGLCAAACDKREEVGGGGAPAFQLAFAIINEEGENITQTDGSALDDIKIIYNNSSYSYTEQTRDLNLPLGITAVSEKPNIFYFGYLWAGGTQQRLFVHYKESKWEVEFLSWVTNTPPYYDIEVLIDGKACEPAEQPLGAYILQM